MNRLAEISLRNRPAAIILLAIVTLFLGSGLLRVRTEFGYRVLVGDDHPSIVILDAFIAEFGGGLPTQIVWQCDGRAPCESVFDSASLRMAAEVSDSLRPVLGVRDVRSPANAPLLVPEEGGFSVRRLIENGSFPDDLDALKRRALRDSLWTPHLISEDGTVGSIIVQTSDNTSETDERLIDAIQEALRPHEQLGFEFHLVGDSVATVITGRELARSTSRLIPVTVLVIAVLLILFFQSWQLAVASLTTMGIALLWTLGLLGWLDWPQDGILEVLAPLILVVGVCDSVHLLSRYASGLPEPSTEPERREALLVAAQEVAPPCLMTTLTTSGALASFSTSALDTFVRFGLISAFGVVVCLVLTFTLLPVAISLLPPVGASSERASISWESALRSVARTCDQRGAPILLSTVLLFLVCGIGWTKLRVDNNWLESFGEHSTAVQWIKFVESRLRPVDTLEVQIALPEGQGIEDPESLARIDRFSESLERVPGLGRATSVTDVVNRLNRIIHDDDPAFERPGLLPETNAELLELVEFDDPVMLSSWLSLDRSKTRISVEAYERSYLNRAQILSSVEALRRSSLPSEWEVTLTGALPLNFDWIRDVQNTQARSFPAALLAVLLLTSIFFRSAALGCAAVAPAVLPVVVTLGTMGWMGMSLDVGRAMIAAVLLGIAVDDSIHLLFCYARLRGEGHGFRDSIRESILQVGRAVVTTSIALSLGFLSLIASAWQTMSSFGFFVSLSILGALASTLFVLPSLILLAFREDHSEPT